MATNHFACRVRRDMIGYDNRV